MDEKRKEKRKSLKDRISEIAQKINESSILSEIPKNILDIFFIYDHELSKKTMIEENSMIQFSENNFISNIKINIEDENLQTSSDKKNISNQEYSYSILFRFYHIDDNIPTDIHTNYTAIHLVNQPESLKIKKVFESTNDCPFIIFTHHPKLLKKIIFRFPKSSIKDLHIRSRKDQKTEYDGDLMKNLFKSLILKIHHLEKKKKELENKIKLITTEDEKLCAQKKCNFV